MRAKHPRGEGLHGVTRSIGNLEDTKKASIKTPNWSNGILTKNNDRHFHQ